MYMWSRQKINSCWGRHKIVPSFHIMMGKVVTVIQCGIDGYRLERVDTSEFRYSSIHYSESERTAHTQSPVV